MSWLWGGGLGAYVFLFPSAVCRLVWGWKRMEGAAERSAGPWVPTAGVSQQLNLTCEIGKE